jgi:hypothetical protein
MNEYVGIKLIAHELMTQDEQGFDVGDDDLALAAVCYALPEEDRPLDTLDNNVPVYWPWDDEQWKPYPTDRVKELIKAGAYIAAEIDRLWSERENNG